MLNVNGIVQIQTIFRLINEPVFECKQKPTLLMRKYNNIVWQDNLQKVTLLLGSFQKYSIRIKYISGVVFDETSVTLSLGIVSNCDTLAPQNQMSLKVDSQEDSVKFLLYPLRPASILQFWVSSFGWWNLVCLYGLKCTDARKKFLASIYGVHEHSHDEKFLWTVSKRALRNNKGTHSLECLRQNLLCLQLSKYWQLIVKDS